MRKEKINTTLVLFTFLFFLVSYCCGYIYTPLKDIFVIINFISTATLTIINRKQIFNDKKIKIIVILQILILMLCKIITNTGIGSIIQMINLLLILIIIPNTKFHINLKQILKVIIPIFIILFIIIPKKHLNPNFVGYIFLCCYIIFVILFELNRKENFFLLIIYSLIMLMLIHMYECRTAMLGLILFIIILKLPLKIYKNNRVKKILPYILIFSGFVFAILYILLWKVGFNLNLRFIADKGIFSGRNRIWLELLPLILKNPIFGLGSNYQLASHSEFALHNTVFMVTATFGIPSMIILFINTKKIIQKIYNTINSKNLLKLSIASLSTLFLVDIFESYIYWSNFNYFFFIIMILIFNNDMLEKKKEKKQNIYIFEEGIDRMGGVERVVSTLANNLSKNYSVNVISFYKTAENPFFKYNKKVKIKYLLGNRNQKSKQIKKKSIVYYFYRAIEMLEDKVKLEQKIARTTRYINENDIVILGRLEVALHVVPYLDNPKKVIVRDAIHYLYYRKGMQRKIKSLLPNNISTLIVSSDESKKIYEKIFKNKNINIKKIYNPLGINPNIKYNFKNKTIVSVGRYSSQKGFENLIKAFKIVNDKKNDWKLKIVGTNHKELINLVESLNIEKNVEFINSSNNVVDILNESSIFVMTSRYEGYANALVEAMACGVPSITYDWLLGSDDIITNDLDGKIVKLVDRYQYANGIDNIEDINNLAKSILMLIDNKKICDEFSIKSSEKINKTRSTKNIINLWEKEIRTN